MTTVYYDHKRSMGYTEEQIERKRLSLDGVLEPLTAMENERLLTEAGYYQTDCFWRWMTFAGWVGVKTWEGPAHQFRDRPA
jgi:tRNA (cmo5U34)-methyltransferase